MRGEVLGPMRRMGEGGAARERGAELVSVCVCGAGAEEECHGYSVSGIRKENSIIKLSSASARIYFASHLRVSGVV